MGWVNLKADEVSPFQEPIAIGDYDFQLLGATLDNASNRLNIKAVIASDGEYTGRRVRFSFPDPDQYDWAPRVFARLREALGVTALPGEEPLTYLNRAAENGGRFGAQITHREYVPEGGDPNTPQVSSDVDIFNFRVAA
jgi:hypothetical protein